MIGVVILNYNNWNDTIECVKSLQSVQTEQSIKMYIIDNCSTVEMPARFLDLISTVNGKYVKTNRNNGYAAGNNVGIKLALEDNCEYIMIANNDIIFQNDIFERMVTFMQNNPNVGIVAPKCLKINGEIQETNLGCKMSMKGKFVYLLRKTPLRRLSKKFVDDFRVSFHENKEPIKVFGVMGCCFVFSSECIKRIGLLDENTFLYEEENIIGCKMEKEKMDVYILPELEVIHKHGQSTKNISTFSYACLVNSEQYYCKNYLGAGYLSRMGLKMIRTFVYLFDWIKHSRNVQDCKEYFNTICSK